MTLSPSDDFDPATDLTVINTLNRGNTLCGLLNHYREGGTARSVAVAEGLLDGTIDWLMAAVGADAALLILQRHVGRAAERSESEKPPANT